MHRRFILLFLALAIGLAALASTGPFDRLVHRPLSRALAATAAAVLSPAGEALARGDRLVFRGFEATVDEACNGVLPITIYLAAVLAFPSRWRERARGALLGVAAILAINLVRVVSLMLVGAFWPQSFERVHIDVWQALVVLLAMAVWVFWVERIVGERRLADR